MDNDDQLPDPETENNTTKSDEQNTSQDDETNTQISPSKQTSDPDSNPNDAPDDSEIKAAEKTNHELSSSSSSSNFRPPDLKMVSEEIGQYISSLSSSHDKTSSNLPDVPIFVEQFMVLVEAKIEDYDDGNVRWTRLTEEDASTFLEAVILASSLSNELMRFSSEYKYACSINHVGGVLQHAMSYLEEEFKLLLEDQTEPNHDPDPGTENQSNNNSVYSEQVLSNLTLISNAMISGGYEIECCQVYFVVRRNALNEMLNKSGFEKHAIDDVHRMSWETLEKEIETWIRQFRQFMDVQLSSERKLSDAIFSGHPEISQNVFGTLAFGVITQLLNFAQAVALSKRSPEKLFKFINVYEVVRDVSIDDLLPEMVVVQIKTETSIIRGRLGESMITIFTELENSIKADSGKSQVPGGAVHPLTNYIMNYLEYACEFKNTLEQAFVDHQKIERGANSATESGIEQNKNDKNTESSSSSSSNQQQQQLSQFQGQVIKVLDLLDSNIEGKSRLYKDPALNSIFMMNNGRYMLKKIKGSQVNGVIGDSWYRKKSSDIRQYHKGYQRETWGKLLNCFHPDGLTVNGKVMKPVLKERFKSFNAMFDEIRKTQSNWVVGDEQLQTELRVSISNMVIPAYRSFLGRYGQTFTAGRQTEKYVKFQPDDMEKYIDELFDGTATPMGKKTKP